MPALPRIVALAIGLVAAVGVASASIESPGAAANAASGPSVVEVPLEESLEVRAAAGWYFADCAVLLAATPLVTSCSAESFTVTGPSYDPEIADVRVPVPLRSGAIELTVDYVIRLAEPSPPDAPDTTLGFPLPAGAVSLIPFSELGLDCGLCSAGGSAIELRGTDRDDLGAAWVTGTHLVFSAAPQAGGRVEVDLRVLDDISKASNTFKVLLDVSAAPEVPFKGLHVMRERGSADLDIRELITWQQTDATDARPDDAIFISSCGPALHGTVRCDPHGRVTYSPPAGANEAPADQFAVRFVAADGRQTIASVTLSESRIALAPAAGGARATLGLSLPRPPVDSEEAPGGVTTTFSELMDALGAR